MTEADVHRAIELLHHRVTSLERQVKATMKLVHTLSTAFVLSLSDDEPEPQAQDEKRVDA